MTPTNSAEQALDEALALVSRTPEGGGAGGHRAVSWPRARDVAAHAGAGVRARTHDVPLADALGEVLTASLDALTDLPSFDTSAMDGWAVAGPGPWHVRAGGGVLALSLIHITPPPSSAASTATRRAGSSSPAGPW